MTDQDKINISAISDALYKKSALLNAESEKLNLAIDCINEFLKKLNIGIPVTAQQGPNSIAVSYERLGSTWCICIQENDNPQTKRAFREAPRYLRLEAVQTLPILLGKLCIEATNTANSLMQANQILSKYLEELPLGNK